jgi:hypothetical protein
MRDLGDAGLAYQQGHGFLGIEHLPDEIEELDEASYAHHTPARYATLSIGRPIAPS